MGTTTQTWTSVAATSGNRFDWLSAANWKTGVVPDTTMDALFPATVNGAYVVEGVNTATPITVQDVVVNDPNFGLYIGGVGSAIPTASVVVADEFMLNAGTITLNDGGFQVGGDGAINGTLTLGNGAIFIGDGLLSSGGGLQVLDTTANTTGDLHFAGGTIIAQGLGAQTGLEIVSAVSGTGNFQVAGNASLILDDTVSAGSTVSFTGGASATGSIVENYAAAVLADSPVNLNINVAGMDVGTGTIALDTIDIAGMPGANASLLNNVITVANAGGGGTDTYTLIGNYSNDAVNTSSDGNGGTFVYLDSVCFVSGTQIQTADGDRPVETLRPGDLVTVLQDGGPKFEPIKWIGYRTLHLEKHPRSEQSAPVRISRGALGENLPVRDLLLSPDHCLLLDAKLIPAKLLVNGMTIQQDLEHRSVTYYHIEMARHVVLLAEGVAAESYLDTGNRAFFSNAGLALMLHPEFHVNAGLRCWATDACAPLAVSPAAVLPVWRSFFDLAVARGCTPPNLTTTTDPDIHLVADGRRIDTISVNAQVHSFLVPAGVRSLTLASRSARPNMVTPYIDDRRELGIAVRGIVIRGPAGRAEFAADHPVLAEGWHAPEHAGVALWRWTTGNAALPVNAVDGVIVVEVAVVNTTNYLTDSNRDDVRLVA